MAASFQSGVRNLSQDYMTTSLMTCDANYQTGGYPALPSSFGDSDNIDEIIPICQNPNYSAIYNKSTGNIQILQDPGTGLAEVAPGTNLSTITVQLLVFGR